MDSYILLYAIWHAVYSKYNYILIKIKQELFTPVLRLLKIV